MLCLVLEAEISGDRLLDSPSIAGLNLTVNDRICHRARGHKDCTLLQCEAQGLFQCSHLRDNVVAFMTFQDFYEQTPDYHSVSIAFMYRVAALTMIAASESLDVFAALSRHWHYATRALGGMPSWVPDWSRK